MSVKNAKAHKSGILFDEKNRKVLIVPFQILISPNYNKNYIFHTEINRQIFHILFPASKRFTLFFNRTYTNNHCINLFVYVSTKTLHELHKNKKQTINRLKNFLNNNGLLIKIINSEIFLQDLLDSIPKKIDEINPFIYKIITSEKIQYLSLAKIYFPPEQERSDLTILLRDFYALLNNGQIILDVSYNPTKSNNKNTLAAISIILENSNLEKIIANKKKLDSLLSIFMNNSTDQNSLNFWFIKKKELLENYGKIILGQSWKSFPIDLDFLNFAAYFNLLINSKIS
ncbi:MAG: hypothetical protein FK731_01255 [Asgard group archaeon]|nr:hypothetical protein [Asgard group archaeon]